MHVAIDGSRDFVESLIKTGMYWYMLLVIYMIIYKSPSNLAYSATRELILCLGFVLGREVGMMHISLLTNEKYSPLNGPVLLVLSSLLLNTLSHVYGLGLFNEYGTLIAMLLISVLSYGHMIFYVWQEMSTALDIELVSLTRNIYSRKI